MRHKLIVLSLVLVVAAAFANADPRLVLGTWQTDWLVCGPFQLQPPAVNDLELQHMACFETDFLESIGGEQNPAVAKGASFTFANREFVWRTVAARDTIVDLDAAISKADYVVGYAYREIQAPSDMACFLSFGSNDGARVWVNGVQIWDRPEPGSVVIDDVLIPVLLKKGKNSLLVKVEERGNKWGFCARFLPLEQRIQSVSFLRVIPTRNGETRLEINYSATHLQTMLSKMSLKVYSQESGKLLWQGDWTGGSSMVLPLKDSKYGFYLLRVQAEFVSGQEWRQEVHFSAGVRRDWVLFDNGKTNYDIVVSPDASASEQWAAAELQRWLEKSGGAWFPIKNKPAHGKPALYIGFDALPEAAQNARLRPDDMDEAFVYENDGADVFIYGGRQRGTMYGVMSFLENEMGVRWYTPTVSVTPQKDRFVFNRLQGAGTPGVRVRNDFYYEAFDPLWAARNKVNGAMNFREQPGGVESYWAVHTFYRFMPPDEFFGEHPEYYSLIDGKRTHDHAQLCLTNPDVLRIVVERLKQTIHENPNNLIYSVSQNDWRNPCQCDKCQAIARREKSEAGPIIWFVNKVAEEIEKEHPDKYVGTLAYQYTRKPPKKIRPRQNVVVRLCSIECCFAHDFKSCPENASFLRDLEGWAAISPHLYIWDYVVNFSHYIMPYPNFRVLQANIQTLRDNKAIGIMEQAAYQSRGGEFAELRAYVLAKLLWNPEADVNEVIDDFMYGYYGRSGQFVRQYFDLLHDQVTPHTHIHLGLTPKDKLFTEGFIRQADVIFDKAEIVADDETILRRVEMARLPLMYLKCKREPVAAKYDGAYQRFCQIVEREGITHYAERGAPHKEAFHREMESVK